MCIYGPECLFCLACEEPSCLCLRLTVGTAGPLCRLQLLATVSGSGRPLGYRGSFSLDSWAETQFHIEAHVLGTHISGFVTCAPQGSLIVGDLGLGINRDARAQGRVKRVVPTYFCPLLFVPYYSCAQLYLRYDAAVLGLHSSGSTFLFRALCTTISSTDS